MNAIPKSPIPVPDMLAPCTNPGRAGNTLAVTSAAGPTPRNQDLMARLLHCYAQAARRTAHR